MHTEIKTPNSSALPLSVLIPTRNSMLFLPGHIEMMRPWLDLAQEVIVVDSESTDGTLEFLKKNLAGCNTRFFQHSPGLYASWNHGIRQATAPHLYISTVGDGISRDGLIHLFDVADRMSPDVIVSPPNFVGHSGRPIRHKNWPVHDIVSFLELKHTACFEGLIPFLLAVWFSPFAILGSSASNLYRTRVLQENPFPTEFGSNGDGAWGVINALKLRFAITPKKISFFREHRRPHPIEFPIDGEERMLAICLRNLEQFLAQNPAMRSECRRLDTDTLAASKFVVQKWRTLLLRHRRLPWPWIANPIAWHARWRRNLAKHDFDIVLKRVLARIGSLDKIAPQPLQTADQ